VQDRILHIVLIRIAFECRISCEVELCHKIAMPGGGYLVMDVLRHAIGVVTRHVGVELVLSLGSRGQLSTIVEALLIVLSDRIRVSNFDNSSRQRGAPGIENQARHGERKTTISRPGKIRNVRSLWLIEKTQLVRTRGALACNRLLPEIKQRGRLQ